MNISPESIKYMEETRGKFFDIGASGWTHTKNTAGKARSKIGW